MSTLHRITDSLPGGEGRAEGRARIEQTTSISKTAKAEAKAAKEIHRPIRTKATWFVAASLLVGTVFYLSRNDGGEAIGEAVSQSAKTGVNVVAGVGSVGVDVARGAVTGTKEGVEDISQDIDIPLDNPLTQDDVQVSNTVAPSPVETVVPGEAPAEYIVVAGDGPAMIAVRCGTLAVTTEAKVTHYETVIVPQSPNLQDGMPNPGDVAVC